MVVLASSQERKGQMHIVTGKKGCRTIHESRVHAEQEKPCSSEVKKDKERGSRTNLRVPLVWSMMGLVIVGTFR